MSMPGKIVSRRSERIQSLNVISAFALQERKQPNG
jgi:hypothetical protein